MQKHVVVKKYFCSIVIMSDTVPLPGKSIATVPSFSSQNFGTAAPPINFAETS